jgi:tripartite-type tricarboxylate transporter receptor subunit TctC
MMLRRDFLRVSALGAVAAPFVRIGRAFAADYPTKPIRWLVGYVPGGTTDILARLFGAYLSEKNRTTVHHREQSGRR